MLRRANFEKVLNLVEEVRPLSGLRLLEIGAAKGWFLEAACARGAAVSGVEPEAKNAEIARSRGFEIEEGLFPHSPSDKGPYDIIVFNDVFEHIPSPSNAIKAVADLLTPDGLVVINLPSSRGPIFRMSQLLARFGVKGPHDRMWQKGMPSPHISYFSPENLRMLVERMTKMRRIAHADLPSVSREGLRERIRSQDAGVPHWLSYSAIWALSFALPALPSDIHVGIFTKGKLYKQGQVSAR